MPLSHAALAAFPIDHALLIHSAGSPHLNIRTPSSAARSSPLYARRFIPLRVYDSDVQTSSGFNPAPRHGGRYPPRRPLQSRSPSPFLPVPRPLYSFLNFVLYPFVVTSARWHNSVGMTRQECLFPSCSPPQLSVTTLFFPMTHVLRTCIRDTAPL